MKICQIYNTAPHYRASIFKLIDQTFDCDYVFGYTQDDIKPMDTSCLRGKVSYVHNKYIKSWYWQKGVNRMLRRKYDSFILLGDTRCLSTWLFCIRARLFYRKKRLYFWSHGWYGKESWIERVVKKLFFRLPNGGTFLYGNYARELMMKEGFRADRLFVIHNSLAYDQQLSTRSQLQTSQVYKEHFGNTHPNLIFVGRLTKVKHLDMVLQAMKQLRERGKRYNLTLIGGGEQKGYLESLANRLGIGDNVWFYGPCYDEMQLGTLIYNADLCVSPGNVGLTAMHVMVFGTPVLTHSDFAHQMPEFEAIHDGETGTFFERGNVDSLADGIERWFADKSEKRESVRQSCFQEIDTQWTPQFQIEVLKAHLK